MKTRLWLFQIPLVALFTFLFYVSEAGVQGELHSEFLRDKVFPRLRTIAGMHTNVKFGIRGTKPVRNNIVIIEIDNNSIAELGRWPWHRNLTANLVDRAFDLGAKVVGLDAVFSEPDVRITEDIQKLLNFAKIDSKVSQSLETDLRLVETIRRHSDKLVLGYTIPSKCQPAYDKPEACPTEDPRAIAGVPAGYEKFGFDQVNADKKFDRRNTPLLSGFELLPNYEAFSAPAAHAGYFDAHPDLDGYVRRTSLVTLMNGTPYPSLALEMAKVGQKEELAIDLDSRHLVKRIGFVNSKRNIPVSPIGVMDINFRGPAYHFDYISALDVLHPEADDEAIRKLASEQSQNDPKVALQIIKDQTEMRDKARKIREKMKDAYVLIGLSALGVFDMRAFPFDSNTPGVEGHANILDNLLSGDPLVYGSSRRASLVIFLLMTVGALLFAFATEKLESVAAMILFITVFGGGSLIDNKLLFERNENFNTSLIGIELLLIFMMTIAAKYVLEEKNKKFIRGAFSKYVAPTIVDSILKDPSKLSVGGEKKDLTILFSDIRGFTTFSERMDAKALALFLNDYLGIMTDIVFACDGTLDKYIGDAVMAFWGAPLDQPKHAYNACQAAIKMHQALAANYERFKTQYGVDVAVGIGVNSGSVNVGNMGSSTIFEYTVIGDHVNLASRVEGLTKHYGVKILTTRFTFDDIVKSGLEIPQHRVLDFVKVKGKKTAVELIHILEREYPAEGLTLFEQGRKHYAERQWDRAIDKFREASPLLRSVNEEADGPCQMYVDRCHELKETPPNADWDGSWEMHSK